MHLIDVIITFYHTMYLLLAEIDVILISYSFQHVTTFGDQLLKIWSILQKVENNAKSKKLPFKS